MLYINIELANLNMQPGNSEVGFKPGTEGDANLKAISQPITRLLIKQ